VWRAKIYASLEEKDMAEWLEKAYEITYAKSPC
jgi:hypothetical protein